MYRSEIYEKVFNDFNNVETLALIDDLLELVINDIKYMNKKDLDNEEVKELDLGNNYYITREDLETITSAEETIYDIVNYNK
jgi:uncharacterized Fe-S radical SAM superfamily protein PflX